MFGRGATRCHFQCLNSAGRGQLSTPYQRRVVLPDDVVGIDGLRDQLDRFHRMSIKLRESFGYASPPKYLLTGGDSIDGLEFQRCSSRIVIQLSR